MRQRFGQPGQWGAPFRRQCERRVAEENAGYAQTFGARDVERDQRQFGDAGVRQFGGEAGGVNFVLDRKPEHVNAGRPFAVGGDEGCGQAFEFVVGFERRIDEDETAFFARGNLLQERRVAVAGEDLESRERGHLDGS